MGSGVYGQKVKTEDEDFSQWKKTVAAANGRGSCGQSRRRDAGVLFSDMLEFIFFWSVMSFPLWDVDSCGVAQFNSSGVTE